MTSAVSVSWEDGSAPWPGGNLSNRPRGPLLRSLLDFNQLSPATVHPSWLSAQEALWMEHVRTFIQPQARLRAAEWLRQRFAFGLFQDHAFEDIGKRVFLLGMEAFQDLALWLGASLCVSSLRRLVVRKHALALREALSEAGMRQLLADFPDDAGAGVQVLASLEAPTPERLYRIGAQALLGVAAEHGAAVLQRTRLKLERRACQAVEPLVNVHDAMGFQPHLLAVAQTYIPSFSQLAPDSHQAFQP
jgi:YOP proteins translocation protein K (YscK)